MTKQEAYALGRVYGYVQEIMRQRTKKDVEIPCASQRPISSMAQIIDKAVVAQALFESDHQWIAGELDCVDAPSSDTEGKQEPVQPLPIQGSWQLGYYSGAECARKAFQRDKAIQAKKEEK